ncbi:unnamed protein product [Amoebophrya sp. A120]|nr:unnamed protein product [Amoebophrya sp. A120]|eukprot:GSA120T00008441001.1
MDAATTTLTPDQEEQLTLFREVTANEDRQRCIQYLEMSNWNVEQAINLSMTGALDNTPATGSDHAAAMNFITGDHEPAIGPQQQTRPSGGDPDASLAQKVVEKVGNAASKVLNGIGGFLHSMLIPDEDGYNNNTSGGSSSSSSSGRANRNSFKAYYERQYKTDASTACPDFFDGTFQQAITKAKDNMKLLMVYFHCETASLTDDFCKNCLNNDIVTVMLSDTCVSFGADINDRTSYDLARQFQVQRYPYLALVLPVSATDYRILHKVDGQQAGSVDGLVALLTQAADDLEQNRAQLVTQANQVQHDRLLRAEQDREYEEALAKDREAEAARQREEEARQKALEEEKQAQLAREQAAKDIEAKRRKLATELVTVDPSTTEAKTKIQVKFPTGQRVNRTFLQSHTLKDLFNWVEAAEYAETGTSIKVPSKFSLNTSFPTKLLQRSDESLKDAGLVPNAQVLLQDLSSDDEE